MNAAGRLIAVSGWACLAAAAPAAEGRVLLDFEKASVAKLGGEFKKQEDALYQVRLAGYYSTEFTATKGPATSGEWALSRRLGKCGGAWLPGVMSHWGNVIFTTSYSLSKLGPADWSGFEALEFNVWSAAEGEVGLAVALEDKIIQPPALRHVKLPGGGKWHAVRIALEPLGQVLNLKDMANFWVVVESCPADTEVRMDDVRLVSGGAAAGLPTIEDPSPVKEAYAKLCEHLSRICPGEQVYRPDGAVKPEPLKLGVDPRKFTAPEKIEKFAVLDITSKTKAHTRRTFPYGLEFFDDKSAIIALQPQGLLYTTDTGKTWLNLNGDEKGMVHAYSGETSWRCEVSGDRGDMLFAGLGKCCGGGLPTTLYFRRAAHTPEGWRFGPAWPVDRDTRHCSGEFDVVRLDSGRIWVAWDHTERTGACVLHARCSDDDGRTWKAAGQTPLIPGSKAADPKLVPLGDDVACLWQADKSSVVMSTSDGQSWTAPAKLPAKLLSSAAAADGRTVIVAAEDGRILRGNGREWAEDGRLPAAGCLSVQRKSGRVHCAWVASAGGESRVFLASRWADGKWGEPRAVAGAPEGGEKDMSLIVSVPRWSPEQFVPVAVFGLRNKSDVVLAQVVKVPAK